VAPASSPALSAAAAAQVGEVMAQLAALRAAAPSEELAPGVVPTSTPPEHLPAASLSKFRVTRVHDSEPQQADRDSGGGIVAF